MNKTEYYKELGINLRRVREANKLSQKDIAAKLGVTYQQYQKYEKGKNRIPTDSLDIFCKMLHCTVSDLTGSNNLEDYQKVYKDATVNYNTNVHNYYYGLFSNLLKMDLSLMKNKIVVASVFIMLITWVVFEVIKTSPDINLKYNTLFLSTQTTIMTIAFAVALFAVFGYSLLTYGVTFFAYIGIYAIVVRFLRAYYDMVIPMVGFDRVIMYGTALVLTFLTFYILRKCKVNLNTDLEAKKKLA